MALCARVLRWSPRTSGLRLMSGGSTENIFADEENVLTEEEIEAKRNIARVTDRFYLRKMKREYTAKFSEDFTIKALRKDYVYFGEQSGINPGVCWPNKEEMADLHYAEEKFFKSFDTLKSELAEKKEAERRARVEREQSIDENLSKLDQWRKEMLAREEKANQEAAKKQAHMDELIREVREHIGYNLSPSDPKFKEVMEMKEAERKKVEKEAKKQLKKQRMMERLLKVPKVSDELPRTPEDETRKPDSKPTSDDEASGAPK
ncbi:growth arrest and DNA damage-inducible proteins-interacting protein 1 [Galendromus occidentalis]|uniref:Large ribosomal subunit protein mL64 n=1 Tax=Galendromus occidentalis TaxID=34638 RepID=A0AAJ6QXY2_9ACAR|nr:growth arrest and DNA damage-inducible proteins-interacting protein 1 [Galendromus occidentalis]